MLATPALAHLLDPGAFILPVMKALYGNLTATSGGDSKGVSHEMHVKTVSAVVDALPSHPRLKEVDSANTAAVTAGGLAFLMSSALPQGMSNAPATGLSDSRNDTNSEEAVTLQFTSGVSSSPRLLEDAAWSGRPIVRHVTLPVANTLFVNGDRTTLFEDEWRVNFDDSEHGATVFHSARQKLTSFQVNLRNEADGFITGGSVPLRALTEPRKVVRSMGNVLAQIEVDGQAVPASSELEKAVMQYISSESARAASSRGGAILVYALIQPSGTTPQTLGEKNETGKAEEIDPSSSLEALFHNSRLFRVTGGGGGWGKKQGLLSLETAVDFTSSQHQDHDTVGLPGLDDDADGASFLRDLTSKGAVPSGSTVQFLVGPTNQGPSSFGSGSASGDIHPSSPDGTTTVVIGTAASPDIDDHQGQEANNTQSEVVFLPGHFGMISYGGAALGTDETSTAEADEKLSLTEGRSILSSRSRVDVPNTSFIVRPSAVDQRMIQSMPIFQAPKN